MKKLVIPAAITLMMGVSTAAQAEFAVYGLLDVCYGKNIFDDAVEPANKADFHSGGDDGNSQCNSTSRFGLKGSLDVGGGVTAKFNLQSNGITSGGQVNDPFFGRQAWFGLAGGFGEVRLGRQDSVPFQTMIDFDFNGASNGVSAGWGPIGTGVGPYARGRQSATLNYIFPAMGGFTAQLGYDPKGNVTDAKDVFSFGVKYAAGPLAVALAHQTKSFKIDGFNDAFTSVAASYDFGVAKVMGSYAQGGKMIEGGSGKGYMLGVVAPVAGINVGAHYAVNTDTTVFTSKTKGFEFFVNKEIFKNTTAYFEVGNTKFSVDGGEGSTIPVKGTGFAVGLIYVF
jgi:predicted porin